MNNTMDWTDSKDIYRIQNNPSIAPEYTFFSSAHATFSRTDYNLDHKTSHNKFENVEIM